MIETEFTPPIPDIVAEIEQLSADLQDKALRSGLTASAKPLKDALKATAPRRSGALSRSIGQAQLSRSARARIGLNVDQRAILVGPVRKVLSVSRGVKIHQGRKANILEGGAAAHVIKPKKNGGFLKYVAGGGVKFVRKIRHPGFGATHFMREAQQQTQSAVGEQFYQGLAKYLARRQRAAAKAAV